jgi:hypothetical protein
VKCVERSRKRRRLARFAAAEQISHQQSQLMIREPHRLKLIGFLQFAKPLLASIDGLAHVSETPFHALTAVPLRLFALRLLCATTIAQHGRLLLR